MDKIKLQAGQEIQDIDGNTYKIEEGDQLSMKEKVNISVLKDVMEKPLESVYITPIGGVDEIAFIDQPISQYNGSTIRFQSQKDKFSYISSYVDDVQAINNSDADYAIITLSDPKVEIACNYKK